MPKCDISQLIHSSIYFPLTWCRQGTDGLLHAGPQSFVLLQSCDCNKYDEISQSVVWNLQYWTTMMVTTSKQGWTSASGMVFPTPHWQLQMGDKFLQALTSWCGSGTGVTLTRPRRGCTQTWTAQAMPFGLWSVLTNCTCHEETLLLQLFGTSSVHWRKNREMLLQPVAVYVYFY